MFNNTKYTRWYYSIIESARNRDTVGYTEGHHIIPKCMGGDNSKANLVRLTAREHFICHQLLVKMVSTDHRSKLALAATKMWQKGKNQHRDYEFNSKTYDKLKKEASSYLSELNRKRWEDPEMRARLVASKSGKTHSEESKQQWKDTVKAKWAGEWGDKQRAARAAKKKGVVLSNYTLKHCPGSESDDV